MRLNCSELTCKVDGIVVSVVGITTFDHAGMVIELRGMEPAECGELAACQYAVHAGADSAQASAL